MDHRVLIVFLLLWSSEFSPGLQTEERDTFKEFDDIRLVGGSSRCSGVIEVKHQGFWAEMDDPDWDLKLSDRVCRHLDCGSVVRTSSTTRTRTRIRTPTRTHTFSRPKWTPFYVPLDYFLDYEYPAPTIFIFTKIICSDSVRLVNGKSLCSGRLEVKSHQSSQSWSSVCEDDFDLQDAEVVCRELGCGAPSVLQGALYGDVEAPMWNKEFQCGGNESALLDCESSDSDRNTCSSGKAVGLTCSERHHVRLVGGSSRCAGELEMKQQGVWRPVVDQMSDWTLKTADEVCRKLDCGSAVSTGRRKSDFNKQIWRIRSTCLQSKSAVRECIYTKFSTSRSNLEIKCSESVRLVNGKSLCSGRLEVKSHQSNQLWPSVCEDDFDLQDAEVVCRELGCGAPSVLQGALYGDMEAPMWTKEFQCGGNESALLDCRSSGSDRNTCSPGKAVGLTCSEPDDVRLLGGSSRCDGTLEMKQHGEWRPLVDRVFKLDQKVAAAVCNRLDCGSAVSTNISDISSEKPLWWIGHSCVESYLMLRECLEPPSYFGSSDRLEVICSDFLAQPNISFATYIDGVSEANQQGIQVLMGSNFTISCSILPQYPGGSFQLVLTTSATSQNHTLPAVNHSAHFLFSAADATHRGEYRCVYHLYVFSQNFSSESQPLHLTVSASLTELIIRLVVLLLGMMILITALCVSSKASRNQKPGREKNTEIKD